MKDKKPAPKVQAPAKRRHDPAVTAANRARRIAKDKAAKERARRKREQRMRATLNPLREAWTVAMVQQTFGTTETRLRGWLADKKHFHSYTDLEEGNPFTACNNNGHSFMGVRRRFVTRNGYRVSIQQSATHYCGADSVEMWECKHHPMLEPYGDGTDPYARVPLRVVAAYIDWLETLPMILEMGEEV